MAAVTEEEKEDKKLGGCGVKSCICKHAYQDKLYGKNMRLMNKCRGGYRCTVCGVSRGSKGL